VVWGILHHCAARSIAREGRHAECYPDGPENSPPALTRSGIEHLYFESIPLEDGNGRIGGALSEKTLTQSLGQPNPIAYTIQPKRKAYYDKLERADKTHEITGWLAHFATMVFKTQQNALDAASFTFSKRGTMSAYAASSMNRRKRSSVTGSGQELRNGGGGLGAETISALRVRYGLQPYARPFGSGWKVPR